MLQNILRCGNDVPIVEGPQGAIDQVRLFPLRNGTHGLLYSAFGVAKKAGCTECYVALAWAPIPERNFAPGPVLH